MIVLGYLVGVLGNRIMVILLYNMLRNENYNIGLVSLCIGGGMGIFVIFKKVK